MSLFLERIYRPGCGQFHRGTIFFTLCQRTKLTSSYGREGRSHDMSINGFLLQRAGTLAILVSLTLIQASFCAVLGRGWGSQLSLTNMSDSVTSFWEFQPYFTDHKRKKVSLISFFYLVNMLIISFKKGYFFNQSNLAETKGVK